MVLVVLELFSTVPSINLLSLDKVSTGIRFHC